jgi:hypothetical protein
MAPESRPTSPPTDSAQSDNASSIPKIEIAKALKAVKAILPGDQFEKVKEIIAPPLQLDTTREMAGLTEEDEFALMCRLMGTTTHLTPLGQTPVFEGDYIVPDFLARFQPGCLLRGWNRQQNAGFRCFIEVKSTTQNHFQTGGRALKGRRAFADIFGLPLLFAIRFVRFQDSALWVIVEDSDRTKNNFKATLADLIEGARPVLWDEFAYMVIPGTYCRVVYSSQSIGSNVVHPTYGEQVTFEVVSGTDGASFSGTDAFLASAFFEGFSLKQVHNETHGGMTEVFYEPLYMSCFVADLVYRMNRLPRDEAGVTTYDPSKLLVAFQGKKQPPVVTRNMVETIGRTLVSKKVLYVLGIGDEEALVDKWHRYGGNSSPQIPRASGSEIKEGS